MCNETAYNVKSLEISFFKEEILFKAHKGT